VTSTAVKRLVVLAVPKSVPNRTESNRILPKLCCWIAREHLSCRIEPKPRGALRSMRSVVRIHWGA
jgi:hypothetical protein